MSSTRCCFCLKRLTKTNRRRLCIVLRECLQDIYSSEDIKSLGCCTKCSISKCVEHAKARDESTSNYLELLDPGENPGIQETGEDLGIQETGDDPKIQETAEDADIRETAEDPGIQETAVNPGVQETTEDPEIQETGEDTRIQETGDDPGIQETAADPGVQETGTREKGEETEKVLQIHGSDHTKPMRIYL